MSSLNAYFQDFAILSLTSQTHYKLMIRADLPTCTYIGRSVNIDKFGLDVKFGPHDMQNISCICSLKDWSFLSVGRERQGEQGERRGEAGKRQGRYRREAGAGKFAVESYV